MVVFKKLGLHNDGVAVTGSGDHGRAVIAGALGPLADQLPDEGGRLVVRLGVAVVPDGASVDGVLVACDGLHVLDVVIEIASGHHTLDVVFVVAIVPELAPFPVLQRNIPGFIFVQHLLGFLASFVPFGKLHFIHPLTNATRRHEYLRGLSRLLPVPGVWVSFLKLRFLGKMALLALGGRPLSLSKSPLKV